MATSPNFSWPEPDNTDLVKNGALAIRTAVDAIDTSLVDLKGGTTGQVLAKASNTDMDFVWSADAAGISPTIFAAKGDLLGASANDTPAILSVGNNGETLVADSSATTGLRWSGGATIANPIINGGLDIWQRGTSFTSPATGTFTADRWNSINTGAATTTITRQTTSDTTNLPNIQYCIRYQRTSGQTNTGNLYLTYAMENSMSTPFIGKTVTVSFYARAGANYSPTSSVLQVRAISGTGTDQNIISGFTGNIDFISSTATLTTTWQRFTYTGTVSSLATQLGFYVFCAPTGTAGAADYYEITGVQFDIGSVALPFRRAGETIQGELAAAQRYYQRWAQTQTGGFANTSELCVAEVRSATNIYAVMPTMSVMRGTPTVGVSAASTFSVSSAGKSGVVAGVAANSSSYYPISLAFTVTGYTAGQAGWVFLNSGGYVEAIAEL